MKKAVIYWSGTGNTAAMASAIAAGMGEGTELYSVDQFTGDIADYDKIAFGCSAMGDEVLEEAEFDPFFTSIEGKLGGKKVALFGSYAGAMDSGCATGQKEQQKQAQTCMTMV